MVPMTLPRWPLGTQRPMTFGQSQNSYTEPRRAMQMKEDLHPVCAVNVLLNNEQIFLAKHVQENQRIRFKVCYLSRT